ncbi:MAG: hypothetical protein KBT49_04965 [Bacteroidetes bacterium]|nr:hypothetical protein [Candidatus Colenecus caballi]
MIGKLKFKTSLFEGVLDGGDDAVFASDDKFAKIMDLVGEYVEPSTEEPRPEDSGVTVDTGDVEPNKCQTVVEGHPVAEDEDNVSPADTGDLINQGLSFFSNLVETLKSPEKTAKLIDRIVVEDKETGKASINIPVQSKRLITDTLGFIGKLLTK